MDITNTQPLHFRTRLDIINSQTGQQQCVYIPNQYANVSAQVWANPTTRKATLKINGTTISEELQTRISELLGRPEAYLFTEIHDQITDPLDKTLDGVEQGYKQFSSNYQFTVKQDSLVVNQKNAQGKFKSAAKVQDNYRANGPAIVRPNPGSMHPPGTKGYRANAQPISPLMSKGLRQTAQEFNSLNGSLVKRVGKAAGVVSTAADTVELGQYVQNGQYDKASSKSGEMAGGWAGARAGASAGARLGMALPIPHALVKAGAVAIFSLGGGIAGSIWGGKIGEGTGGWLYQKATEKAPESFKAFPTDINNDSTGIHMSSDKLFNGSGDDIFAYRTLSDGTVIPIKHSDLSHE